VEGEKENQKEIIKLRAALQNKSKLIQTTLSKLTEL
jgi:hypothetical protein